MLTPGHKGSSGIILAVAFFVSFFAVGIPYWRILYSQASLPSSLYGFGLIVVFAAAAASRCIPTVRFWAACLVVGASVPAMIVARITYETSSDPTSHNLWPFEVVIALAVGLAVSFAGSLAGGFLVPRFGGYQDP